MPELLTVTPPSALGIYAHPDDPDVSCGGTLARWAAAGCEVRVLLCTDGDKGTSDPGVSPGALAAQRVDEVLAAGKVLGLAGIDWLHHPDGELDDDLAFRAELVAAVRRFRPEVVFCPDPTAVFFGQDYVNHRDHRTTGWAALDAVSPAAALPLYFPEAGPAHQVQSVLMTGSLEPDVWVDVTGTLEAKVEAVGCHRSQFADGGEWARSAVRLGAEDAGRRAGVPYAEGFRRLRLGG